MESKEQRFAAWAKRSRGRFSKPGICLFPETINGPCYNAPIGSHSLAKSSMLQPVSRRGHIYHLNSDPYTLKRTGGFARYALLGIQKASTFSGFCRQHDTDVFKRIDKPMQDIEREDAFLLHYRALTKEFYTRGAALSVVRGESEIADSPFAHPGPRARFVSEFNRGQAWGYERLREEKDYCDSIFTHRNFSGVSAYVCQFEATPPVVCSGLFQPVYDVNCRTLQMLEPGLPSSRMSLSLIPSALGGTAVYSWVQDERGANNRFISALNKLSAAARASAIFQNVFDSFENHYMSPDWWDNQPDFIQNEVYSRTLNWMHPLTPLRTDALVPILPSSLFPTLIESRRLRSTDTQPRGR